MTPDPWRKRCPEGHCSWVSRGDGIWCEQCDVVYQETVDVRERELDEVDSAALEVTA